jgi:small-conductance mechanosensitive channel
MLNILKKKFKAFVHDIESRIKRNPVSRFYDANDHKDASIAIWLVASFFALLQKCSIAERIKRSLYDLDDVHPIYLESYLVVFWFFFLPFIWLVKTYDWLLPLGMVLLTILQIVQANIYHEVFRPDWRENKKEDRFAAHSRVRSLLIGLFNYVMVAIAFGHAYWIVSDGFLCNPKMTLLDFIYFSFTFAWSAGSESIPPGALSPIVKLILIFQVIVTLFLIAIILSIASSGIPKIEDRKRSDKVKGSNDAGK